MGTLIYDRTVVEFDDRLLAHLQIVLVQKFRREEAFLMSWINSVSIGDGRSAMWLTPTAPVYFRFSGSRVPEIDRGWLDLLSESAASSTGLVVVESDGKLARATGLRRE